jgi:hypothetical protein
MASSATLTILQAAVRALLINIAPGQISDAALTEQIRDSLRRLDNDRPFGKFAKLAGTGSKYYKLGTLLTDWDDDVSRVLSVVYPAPVIADNATITKLNKREYQRYDDGTDQYLRFESAPDSSNFFRIEYTVARKVKGLDAATTTNLEDRYLNAITYLATAMCCYSLGTRSAGLTEPNVNADFINFGSKESQYRRMGDKWLQNYQEEVGSASGTNASNIAAGSWGEYEAGSALGPRITHDRVRS